MAWNWISYCYSSKDLLDLSVILTMRFPWKRLLTFLGKTLRNVFVCENVQPSVEVNEWNNSLFQKMNVFLEKGLLREYFWHCHRKTVANNMFLKMKLLGLVHFIAIIIYTAITLAVSTFLWCENFVIYITYKFF